MPALHVAYIAQAMAHNSFRAVVTTCPFCSLVLPSDSRCSTGTHIPPDTFAPDSYPICVHVHRRVQSLLSQPPPTSAWLLLSIFMCVSLLGVYTYMSPKSSASAVMADWSTSGAQAALRTATTRSTSKTPVPSHVTATKETAAAAAAADQPLTVLAALSRHRQSADAASPATAGASTSAAIAAAAATAAAAAASNADDTNADAWPGLSIEDADAFVCHFFNTLNGLDFASWELQQPAALEAVALLHTLHPAHRCLALTASETLQSRGMHTAPHSAESAALKDDLQQTLRSSSHSPLPSTGSSSNISSAPPDALECPVGNRTTQARAARTALKALSSAASALHTLSCGPGVPPPPSRGALTVDHVGASDLFLQQKQSAGAFVATRRLAVAVLRQLWDEPCAYWRDAIQQVGRLLRGHHPAVVGAIGGALSSRLDGCLGGRCPAGGTAIEGTQYSRWGGYWRGAVQQVEVSNRLGHCALAIPAQVWE